MTGHMTGRRGPKVAPAARAHWPIAGVAALAPLLAACAGGIETASLPRLEVPVPTLPKLELPEGPPPVVGAPTEVYTRVARGALTCWLGASGPLKGTHIFHADAEPAHKGGRSEIILHERDPTAPSPRGLKAFRVVIAPDGERTTIEVENLKLPKPVGEEMTRDVRRWGAGEIGCEPAATAWQPPATPEALAAASAPADRKQKPAGTAARR